MCVRVDMVCFCPQFLGLGVAHSSKTNKNGSDAVSRRSGQRQSSLARRLIASAHSPTGLCIHPLSRTKEPYEIDLATSGSYMENMFGGRTDAAPCSDANNKELYSKELSGMILCTSVFWSHNRRSPVRCAPITRSPSELI